MKGATKRQVNRLWLQSGGCGGCTMSLLGAEAPDLLTTLKAAGIHLLWHPGISEQMGSELYALLQSIISEKVSLDLFCMEGSVPV